jgi:hypothetical protein
MHRAFNILGKMTLLFAVLALTFTGCGYRRPHQVKTSGTVTLDGDPVASASLTFIPDSGRPAFAVTNTNGEFQVSSYGGNDGLPAGSYRIIAVKEELKERFQKQYEKQVARAKAEAEPGEEPEEVELEFGDSAYENMLPSKYEELETTDITVTITKQQEPLVITLTSE